MRVIPAGEGARNVHVHLDVEYAVKDGRGLRLLVLQPSVDWSTATPDEMAAEQFPLIVYVQGSGWREQQVGANVDPLTSFARRGYVIAIVEHRPSSVAAFPAQVADAQTATRWLLHHAATFHIDSRRVAVWGDSSGGHTALMCAVAGGDTTLTDEPGSEPLPISVCVDFYGPTALDLMDSQPTTMAHRGPGSPEADLLGVETLDQAPDLVRRADPRTYLGDGQRLPAFLIAHGSKDRAVPFHQSVLVYEALRSAGHRAELIQVKGAGHGGPTFWTPELLDLVDRFLVEHLPEDRAPS
jgi:acetyl esterase/lipase